MGWLVQTTFAITLSPILRRHGRWVIGRASLQRPSRFDLLARPRCLRSGENDSFRQSKLARACILYHHDLRNFRSHHERFLPRGPTRGRAVSEIPQRRLRTARYRNHAGMRVSATRLFAFHAIPLSASNVSFFSLFVSFFFFLFFCSAATDLILQWHASM